MECYLIEKHGKETIKLYYGVQACQQPQITAEIETRVDVNTAYKKVKAVLDIQCIKKRALG